MSSVIKIFEIDVVPVRENFYGNYIVLPGIEICILSFLYMEMVNPKFYKLLHTEWNVLKQTNIKSKYSTDYSALNNIC